MASRSFHSDSCPGIGHVEIDFSLVPQGAASPLGGEGTSGNFVTWARTGTGTYTITTVDKYLAVVAQSYGLVLATPVANWNIQPGAPVQNANGTWTLTFTSYLSAVATDIPLAAGNTISCYCRFRNSTVKP